MNTIKEIYFFIGRAICHQLESRSLMINGQYLPLASRTTGIFLGMFITLLYLSFRKRIYGNKLPGISVIIIMAIGMVPLMFDGITSYAGLRETNNATRIITGFLFGAPIPIFLTLARNFDISKDNTKPILDKVREYFYILVLGGVVSFLIYQDILLPWWLVSTILIGTVVILFVQVFLLLIKQVSPKMPNMISYTISVILTIVLITGLSLLSEMLLKNINIV